MGTHTSGPVPVETDLYVKRVFEEEVFRSILKRDWVVLLGPRQHGKTSALIRIKLDLEESGFRVALVDLQSQPPPSTYEKFLEWFGHTIFRQIGKQIEAGKPSFLGKLLRSSDPKSGLEPPKHKGELVAWLEAAIGAESGQIVIMVDEAATITNDDWRNSFYGQIRALANTRATAGSGDIASRITFVFSGTFRIESLVETANSPFNVCKEHYTENLSENEVRELCKLSGEENEQYSAGIWEYVGGQPFLVQYLLSEIEGMQGDQADKLHRAIARLEEEVNHPASILSKVIEDPALTETVSKAIENNEVDLVPADYGMKYLQVLGLMIKKKGKLVFSNDYYRQVATASPQLTKKVSPISRGRTKFFELNENDFGVIQCDEMREIVYSAHKGAVSAYNSGSYRLALTGYGAALEGLLCDWISHTDPAKVAAAASSCSPNFNRRYENANDPQTWRMVNLVNVGKELANTTLTSAADIPDIIRDWRNCVHPNVILADYHPESEMEPYVVTAEGLFRTTLQQIGR